MSATLKIYNPAAEFADEDEIETREQPRVLAWRIEPGHSRGFPQGMHLSMMEVVARSRLLNRNRTCRHCGRPTVTPVEKDDGMIGKNRLPIPGTATLLGFHCEHCQSDWPA